MDAIGRDEQEATKGRFVDDLSWFAPLLAPTWLLPGVSKDAARVELAAERWPEETPLDQDGAICGRACRCSSPRGSAT